MAVVVERVRRFRTLRALVVGDVMLDSYLEGTAARLCTEGPVPVVKKTAEEHAPGGAANVAANLRALGADVTLIGLVGDDVPGMQLRRTLQAKSINPGWLVQDHAVATLHKMRILATGQYVVRFDQGDTGQRSAEGEARMLANLDAALSACDVVVVSDYGYGALSDRIIAWLRELRQAHPVPLVVDSKQLLRFAGLDATLVTPNHLEARLLVQSGAALDSRVEPKEIEQVGMQLLDRLGVKHVAVTMAEHGVCLIDRERGARHFPAHPVANPNDVGAGDSFASAAALMLGAGGSVEDAVRTGIEAASIAVAKRQTAVVDHQELLQRISLRDHAARTVLRGTPIEALAAKLEMLRAAPDGASPTVVFTNGVFDILHAGHVELLHRARALGDILVVAVNSDRSARALKGKGRPINGERDRLALVAALDGVDYAVLFDEETPSEAIRLLRPDIHVKGGDYAGHVLPEADAVRDVGGRIEIVPLVGALSTSMVIDRIVSLAVDAGHRPLQEREAGAEVGR